MRLLIAEDEKDLNKLITKKLTSENYSVDSCFDGEEALDFLEIGEYDGIILDIMMPKVSGLEVVTHLRSAGNTTPVLFLTARDSVEDRVLGLDLGANDYLVKPFSFAELLARVRAMLRSSAAAPSNVFTAGDLELDTKSHIAKRAGKEIVLSTKEYTILEYMIRNKNIVLSREKIENHIWNMDFEGGTNLVDVYISYLRKKIDEGFDHKLIKTIRGAGYMLKEKE